MDFIKKNVAWIALIALAISVYLLYQMKKSDDDTSTTKEGSFAGKKNITNPVNQ